MSLLISEGNCSVKNAAFSEDEEEDVIEDEEGALDNLVSIVLMEKRNENKTVEKMNHSNPCVMGSTPLIFVPFFYSSPRCPSYEADRPC